MKLCTGKPETNGIQFDLAEWNIFMSYKDIILNFFDTKNKSLLFPNRILTPDFTLIFNVVSKKHILTISWHEFAPILKMFKIYDLILHKLQFINSLNFNKYYKDILQRATEHVKLNFNCTVMQSIETVLNKDINVNVLAFKELLHLYAGDKLYNDYMVVKK